jgi:glycosyltransferase involved in cell wall biosynthesis
MVTIPAHLARNQLPRAARLSGGQLAKQFLRKRDEQQAPVKGPAGEVLKSLQSSVSGSHAPTRLDLGQEFQPLVSVIVPFYNCRATIRRTVLSLIDQDFPKTEYEILLVDDCSTDETAATVADLLAKSDAKMRVLSLAEHRGGFAARNVGLENSRGRIVAFIDADEIADRNWLKHLTRRLLEGGEIKGVAGRVVTDMNATLILPLTYAPIYATGVTSDGVLLAGSGNVAYSREVLLHVGGFDERFDPKLRGDSDLCLRVQSNGFRMAYEGRAVVYHPASERTIKQVLSAAFVRYNDVLLYSKHSKHGALIRAHVGGGITKPLVGSFSPLGILILVLGCLVSYAIIVQALETLFCLFLVVWIFWLAWFIFRGYRLCSEGPTPKMPLRIKSAFMLPLYLFVVFLGRLYGCVRYRSILI